MSLKDEMKALERANRVYLKRRYDASDPTCGRWEYEWMAPACAQSQGFQLIPGFHQTLGLESDDRAAERWARARFPGREVKWADDSSVSREELQ